MLTLKIPSCPSSRQTSRSITVRSTSSKSRPTSPSPPNQIIYSITVEPLPAIKVFSTSIDSSDPLSYLDAMSRKDATRWRKAMEEEIQSIIDNKTWELSDLPPNPQVIDTK